jgi:hypothetical protein
MGVMGCGEKAMSLDRTGPRPDALEGISRLQQSGAYSLATPPLSLSPLRWDYSSSSGVSSWAGAS